MISKSTWAVADLSYKLDGCDQGLPFSFRWQPNPLHEGFVARTFDLIIEPRDARETSRDEEDDAFCWPTSLRQGLGTQSPNIQVFIDNEIRKYTNSSSIGIKLILPARSGFVARSDIIEMRMHGCTCTDSVSGFMQPGENIQQHHTHEPCDEIHQLTDILAASIGAMSVNATDFDSIGYALDALEDEFRYRVGISFLLSEAIPRKRVAIVHCPYEILTYEAIKCLGLDLVVLDKPGHFLESPKGPFAHLRESFHPIDLNVDDGLFQRIVEIAKDLDLDGIFTRYDFYTTHVAKAAQILGLPTSPYSAYAVATNKYAARMLEAKENGIICVNNEDELEQRLRDPTESLKIEYPVIVKPCTGWSSLNVAKARDEVELITAVQKAHSRILGHEGEKPIQSRVLIEPYIDGPEVDVNFVLWNGEILFSDISDDFPSLGDMDEKTGSTDFQETIFAYPSRLPKREKDMLYKRLSDCVARMGFRTGIIHCEARMKNSAMRYVEKDGVTDLEMNLPSSKELDPSVFMIEVNPRPPGYFAVHGITWTYGVDYYALHVLRCVMDEKRFRALAVPFSNEVKPSIAVLNIMPDKGGILRSSDPAIRLREEKPLLRESITLYRNYFQPGDYVPPPDAVETSLLAVVVVESKHGRRDLLQKVEEIREEWSKDLLIV